MPKWIGFTMPNFTCPIKVTKHVAARSLISEPAPSWGMSFRLKESYRILKHSRGEERKNIIRQ